MAAGVSATAIALGAGHTCAIEAGGRVKCWGWNRFGQLGIGSTVNQTSPVAVPGVCLWGGGAPPATVCMRAGNAMNILYFFKYL